MRIIDLSMSTLQKNKKDKYVKHNILNGRKI